MSRGNKETEILIENLESQLARLLAQLEDLEELRDCLDDDEYEETKAETLEQLEEFQVTLDKMIKGDNTLVDKLSSIQLALQATVSQAFKTPEVIKLFAKKEPDQLRQRLDHLKKQVKLGKTTREAMLDQAVEILAALQKLGQELSPEEETFLEEHKTAAMSGFEDATQDLNASNKDKILKVAQNDVSNANN
eukprot:TRINITY_DN1855_c0_g4_i1.p1 TRINITY_DN1855_c0_g4~~TRINITY_DN1855_c0_g4_i1.p1  ORF type:complete len:192 (+),score=61.04 TRINITY_DN1855_c0_g4_i1:32-607(+)